MAFEYEICRIFFYLCYTWKWSWTKFLEYNFYESKRIKYFQAFINYAYPWTWERVEWLVWPFSFLLSVFCRVFGCFLPPIILHPSPIIDLISSMSLSQDFLCGAPKIVSSIFQLSASPSFCHGISVPVSSIFWVSMSPDFLCVAPEMVQEHLLCLCVSWLPPWCTAGGIVGSRSGCGREWGWEDHVTIHFFPFQLVGFSSYLSSWLSCVHCVRYEEWPLIEPLCGGIGKGS